MTFLCPYCRYNSKASFDSVKALRCHITNQHPGVQNYKDTVWLLRTEKRWSYQEISNELGLGIRYVKDIIRDRRREREKELFDGAICPRR